MRQALSADELDDSLLRFAVHARELMGVPLRDGATANSASFGLQTPPWPLELPREPTALEFARVLHSHSPVIINNALLDRTRLWNEWKQTAYLSSRLAGGSQDPDAQDTSTSNPPKFPVSLTPDGRADDLAFHPVTGQTVFALPQERELTFDEFVAAIHADPSGPVAYLQSQNSNLDPIEESDATGLQANPFRPLLEDLLHSEVQTELDALAPPTSYPQWAGEALNSWPEATNLWIGSQRSRSSMHRDHYENLFLVVRGTKTFTVLPPTEGHFLSGEDRFYPLYRWAKRDDQPKTPFRLEAVPDSQATPWIPIDPLAPPARGPSARSGALPRPSASPEAQARWAHFRTALDPLRIQVRAGQMLYLPAGWFHAVEQREDTELVSPAPAGADGEGGGPKKEVPGLCVAVNWWWNSEPGDRWAWLSLVRELDRRCKGFFEPNEEMM